MDPRAMLGIEDLVRDLSADLSQAYRWIAEQAGLNPTDLIAMQFIARSDGAVSPSALADHLGLTTGATAILIKRLERRGILVRTPHPTDRRAALLSLGEAAKEHTYLKMRERLSALNADVIAALSPEEAKIIRTFMIRIAENTRTALRRMQAEGGAGISEESSPAPAKEP